MKVKIMGNLLAFALASLLSSCTVNDQNIMAFLLIVVGGAIIVAILLIFYIAGNPPRK